MPSPFQGTGDLLGILVGSEWANAYPIIFSCWPIAWGEIGLLKPGLQLAEYLLSLLAILECSHLYLKEGCFVWTGLLRFRWLFRDCHSYRTDSLLNQPDAVSGRLR